MSVWRVFEAAPAVLQSLVESTGLPPALVCALLARGIDTSDAIRKFLDPRLSDLSDPFLLQGMEEATVRIRRSLREGERIVVYGDYDADGVTATALLVSVLRRLGGTVSAFLPDRRRDGYGLGVQPLSRCLEQTSARLVVTADCGTGSREAVAWARERGVDVVVTDHHEASETTRAEGTVLNPLLGSVPGTADLAGVGVAFKLCHGLVKKGLAEGWPAVEGLDLRDYLGAVAIGTVADVVRLTGENRILVRHGLLGLNAGGADGADVSEGRGAFRKGLRALRRAAGLETEIDTHHLSFVLGPRLNAAGRMGSAERALELLLAEDAEQAWACALDLEAANEERRRTEQGILEEALADAERHIAAGGGAGMVVGRGGWHVGTIGIVAGRLCERYGRPAAVVSYDDRGEGRGSCRSVRGIDIVKVLGRCSDLLRSFGGHRMAAGFNLARTHHDAFVRRFAEVCAEEAGHGEDDSGRRVDAWVLAGDLDADFYAAHERLKPFGMGNPRPVLGIRGMRLLGAPRRVGKDHLKVWLGQGGRQFEAIGFGMAGMQVPEGPVDALFHLHENRYGGRAMLELRLQDLVSGQE